MSKNTSNLDWIIEPNTDGSYQKADCQLLALLDIRRELQKLNNLLHCPNFTDIPKTLKKIAAKKRRKKVTGKK